MKQILVLATLILAAPLVSAHAKKKSPDHSRRHDTVTQGYEHPFFAYLNFSGQAYADRKNPECEPGFIGWYRESEEEDPIFIIPNDAFRNIQTDCRAQDLKLDNVSCLSKNSLQRRLDIRGDIYILNLKMLEKAGKPIFQIKRFIGKKLQKSCLYSPMTPP